CRYAILFCNATAPTAIYTLSLHDALPIYPSGVPRGGGGSGAPRHHRTRAAARAALGTDQRARGTFRGGQVHPAERPGPRGGPRQDRKSTRLNSSHVKISYAVFCLKKKKNK